MVVSNRSECTEGLLLRGEKINPTQPPPNTGIYVGGGFLIFEAGIVMRPPAKIHKSIN
jgi:hypothetical protein